MSRRGQAVQHPAAEVDVGHLVRVGPEPEELPGTAQLCVDDQRVGTVRELRVTRDMVAVGMCVEDKESVAVPRVPGEPPFDEFVDDPAQWEEIGRLGRAGVDEHGFRVAEHQEQERACVAPVLADSVLVVEYLVSGSVLCFGRP